MARIPKQPEEIFPEFLKDYQLVFGPHLLSIILYGSGAGQDYMPGRSDLNFLITLTEQGIDRLDLALETVKKWRRRKVAIPLFMTRAGLAGSLDSYPVEILNMRRSRRVVFGEDVLADLEPSPHHIRLQLERELRGKLLHLRSGYLATEGSVRRLRELIGLSLTAFVSLLAALLHIKGQEIPADKRAVIGAAGEALGIDARTFLLCEEVRRRTDRLSRDQIRALFRDYLKEVGRLCEMVEAMEVPQAKTGDRGDHL